MTDVGAGIRYIPLREVAAMVRNFLAGRFPITRFSVRIERHAAGGWIDVRWSNGPSRETIAELLRPYSGRYTDGATDTTYDTDTWLCEEHGLGRAQVRGGGSGEPEAAPCCDFAELVSMGAGLIMLHRHEKES